jgi:uncharacterized protein YdhG (YjbR/CyaY superfamily)
METVKAKDIDMYIASFPEHTRVLMEQLRIAIRQAAPKAVEVISYGMPAFRQDGILVYFAGYKKHIGFYPTASPIKIFEKELEGYTTSKGAIQLPLEKPIPMALIKKIVKYRVVEDKEKTILKAEMKKKK